MDKLTFSNRLLVISYRFLPYWSTGVIRIVKAVKYLSRLGWDISVLTPKRSFQGDSVQVPGDKMSVSVRSIPFAIPDWYQNLLSALKSLKPSAPQAEESEPKPVLKKSNDQIYKFKWIQKIESFFFPIDIYITWVPVAFLFAFVFLIRNRDVRTVWISGPPFSQFLVGVWLKKFFGRLRLVVDFRDHWLDNQFFCEPTFLHRGINRWAYGSVVQNADAIVFVSEVHFDRYKKDYPGADNAHLIHNGFDPDDFSGIKAEAPSEKVRLAYFGNIGNRRNIAPLLGAVSKLAKENVLSRENFELVFYGVVHPYFQQLAFDLHVGSLVAFNTPLPYREALVQMKTSTGLLLVIDDDPHTSCYPTKFFEYLACEKPIVVLGPERGAGALVRKENVGRTVPMEDQGAIEKVLRGFINKNIVFAPGDTKALLNQFRRDRIAERIGDVLKGRKA